MSAMQGQLCDTARAVFAEGSANALAEAGFDLLLVPEAEGGFGGDWGDAVAVLRIAGATDPALPVAEAILGERLAQRDWRAFAAVARSAGALGKALALAIDHGNSREQFGRPLAKFQSVQQALAQLACEVAAADVAAFALADRLDRVGGDVAAARFELAAAKLRTNRAIGAGTAIAHQMHGAIGFTADHPLHRFTTALMRWRSEGGNDAHWARVLGDLVVPLGGAGVWAELTARGE
jgi:alkylation response protein AidB-like acyl-CoA dehydrogenase